MKRTLVACFLVVSIGICSTMKAAQEVKSLTYEQFNRVFDKADKVDKEFRARTSLTTAKRSWAASIRGASSGGVRQANR